MKISNLLPLVISVLPLPALACSMASGYLRPSNYDLVKETDLILLARSTDMVESKKSRGFMRHQIQFQVLHVLKGTYEEKTFSTPGHDNFRGRSDAHDFSRARPGAYGGSCNAYDYRLKKHYLLFVNDGLVTGPAFSRINEEVDGLSSPWVRAVQAYIGVAAQTDYEQEKNALKALQNEHAGTGDGSIPGLVADIDRHFQTPYPNKSFEDLLAIYKADKDPDKQEDALWAMAHKKDPQARELMHDLLTSGNWKTFAAPVCDFLQGVPVEGDLKVLSKTFSSRKGSARRYAIETFIKRSTEADMDRMLRLLKSATKEEMEQLAPWFTRYKSPEALKLYNKAVGKRYVEQWELALWLAQMGDEKVIAWAKDPKGLPDDKAWLRFYFFAQSHLPEADAMVRETIQRGLDEELTTLVQAYREGYHNLPAAPNRLIRLEEIVNRTQKSENLVSWLKRTLQSIPEPDKAQAEALLRQL